jgi:hypothetical protein
MAAGHPRHADHLDGIDSAFSSKPGRRLK